MRISAFGYVLFNFLGSLLCEEALYRLLILIIAPASYRYFRHFNKIKNLDIL